METSSTSSAAQSWPSSESQPPIHPKRGRARANRPFSRQPRTRAKSGTEKSSKPSKHRNRRDELLRRFGLSSEQVAAQPSIGGLIAQTGVSPLRVIEVLRADSETDSQKIVQVWDSLTPVNRRILGFEAVALAAGIVPKRLWQLYGGAAVEQGQQIIGAMIADALPKIMAVTIKDAKTKKGFASREHIYKAARVLPTPKGSVTNISVGTGAAQLEAPDDDDLDGEGLLKPADEELMKFNKAMSPKALPAPEAEIIDEPEIDEDDEASEE